MSDVSFIFSRTGALGFEMSLHDCNINSINAIGNSNLFILVLNLIFELVLQMYEIIFNFAKIFTMKRTLLILSLFASIIASAQQRLVYQSYMLGSDSGDTTFREVLRYKTQLKIHDIQEFEGTLIQGLSKDFTYVDYSTDSAYFQMNYDDGESYFYSYPLKTNDVEFEEKGEEKILGYNCKKYKTSINSRMKATRS